MRMRYGWRPYVPVARRQANAARELTKLQKKSGQIVSPVVLTGKTIAATFWGQAWCDNLEAYSDYENRLPRGRSYVRNGSVVDLQISHGQVQARVCGSALYTIKIKIAPLQDSLWKRIQRECSGKIDSLLELLQGRLSSGVMQIVTRPRQGLFPAPPEIGMSCSCPDWAGMCKHVAAALYGVGARLDEKPDLLFLLRGVDPGELVSQASATHVVSQGAPAHGAPSIGDTELAEVFGIELETATPATPGSVEIEARTSPVRSKAKPARPPKRKSRSKPKAALPRVPVGRKITKRLRKVAR